MQNVMKLMRIGGAALCSVLFIGGCSMPAERIKSKHWDLNETIRQTNDEQLLLNMVRMRYEESPYFLQISSISTSFSVGGNAGVQATLPSGGDGPTPPNLFTPSLGMSYSETPTVTWSMPDSREFLSRFYAPISAHQLTVLINSGFDIKDVLTMSTRKVNALRNRGYSLKHGLNTPSEYDEFLEAIQLMTELIREGLADTVYTMSAKYGGVTLPIEQMDPRGVAEGLPFSLLYLSREAGQATPLMATKPLHLRFTKESDNDPRSKRLRELWKLRAENYTFPIVDILDVSPEGLRSLDGRLAQVFDPKEKLAQIMISNRSVIDILQFASAFITVPDEDIEKGLVRERHLGEHDRFTVLNSATEPDNAWLKVQYRDKWFYVPQSDLNSRSTFVLMRALFSSVVGEVPGAQPLLTLPVN